MRVLVCLPEDKRLRFFVGDGVKYEAGPDQIFDAGNFEIQKLTCINSEKDLVTKDALSAGKKLHGYIPRGFHDMLANRRDALIGDALILILEKPLLMNYPWEYVPAVVNVNNLRAGDGINITWQALPMFRSIPYSTVGRRTSSEDTVRYGCFYSGIDARDLLARHTRSEDREHPESADLPNITVVSTAYEDDLTQTDIKRRYRDEFTSIAKMSDYLYIACHGKKGRLLLNSKIESAFLAPENLRVIDDDKFPRFVSADVCHAAESADEKNDRRNTFAGAFIREGGAALYYGSLGEAYYHNGKTVFSDAFVDLLKPDRRGRPRAQDQSLISFAKSIRNKQTNENDANNSQVIYVAANINLKMTLKELLTNYIIEQNTDEQPVENLYKYLSNNDAEPGSVWPPPLPAKILGSLTLAMFTMLGASRIFSINPGNFTANLILGFGGAVGTVVMWLVFKKRPSSGGY